MGGGVWYPRHACKGRGWGWGRGMGVRRGAWVQAIASGPVVDPTPLGAGGGGGVRGQDKLCGPKIGLKFPAPLIKFSSQRHIFLMRVGGAGWGPKPSPPLPPRPLAPGSLSHGLRLGGGGGGHIHHSPGTPNHWAPRTRKRHQQEHRPQQPTQRSDPTQHAEGGPVTVQGPVKEQQPDGMSHRGGVIIRVCLIIPLSFWRPFTPKDQLLAPLELVRHVRVAQGIPVVE